MKTKAREYMTTYRESLGLTILQMATRCRISQSLLSMLEGDESNVTHPNIVKRVGKAYKLTKAQRTAMLPPNHRPGPDYNPDKYKEDPSEEFKHFRIIPTDRKGFYNYV